MAITSGSGVLTVSVDTSKVENMLNGYKRTLPEAVDKATKRIAGMYAMFYLQQLERSNIERWTGQAEEVLSHQIKNPVKLGKNEYGVVVPQYLIALDTMKPHWVSLRRGRSITRWYQDKINKLGLNARVVGETYGKVFVRPHPWSRQANIRAGKNVRTLAESELNGAVMRKGK